SVEAVCAMTMRRRNAFSLVELLAVLAVLAILAVLVVPAVSQSLRAARLTTEGQHTVDLLNFARQTALSRNASVEVRCYMLPDYTEPAGGAPSVYRAVQPFLIEGTRAVPLERAYFFSAPVRISSKAAESALLASDSHPETEAGEDSPTLGAYG